MNSSMVKIGVYLNWIPHIPRHIYEVLISTGILAGFKFPGIGVDEKQCVEFIKLVKELGCSVDNHGWKGLTGALHDPDFAKQIDIFSGLAEYLSLPGAFSFSSHIGAPTSKLPYGHVPKEWFDKVLVDNLAKVRATISMYSSEKPLIYGEGIFPVFFDERTVHPDFLSSTLKPYDQFEGLNDGLDGLVVDVAHGSIVAEYLAHKPSYKESICTFEDYVRACRTSMVKIVHISGGYRKNSGTSCCFRQNIDMDPHIPSSDEDLSKLIFVLDTCPNVEKVSSEIAYSFYHGHDLLPCDYCREAILTYVAVMTRSMSKVNEAKHILARLHNDCLNFYSIIDQVKQIV